MFVRLELKDLDMLPTSLGVDCNANNDNEENCNFFAGEWLKSEERKLNVNSMPGTCGT